MNECKKSRSLWLEALYEELTGPDAIWFQDHLHSCKRCSRLFQEYKRTTSLLSQRKRTEPDEAYWNTYWEKLSERLPLMSPVDTVKPKRYFRVVPAWALKAAAAILLVLGGAWMGKYYWREPAVPLTSIPRANIKRAIPVDATDAKALRFLQRSQILLLALVNSDPHDSALDMTFPKSVSQELIQDASTLKGELQQRDQVRLKRLIDDLEVILLQIANLDAEKDIPEIEIVKSGVDERAILLKIDLEQARMNTPRSEERANKRSSSL